MLNNVNATLTEININIKTKNYFYLDFVAEDWTVFCEVVQYWAALMPRWDS